MTTEDTTTEPVVYEKGSWQEALNKSATLLDRSTKARKQASNLLWMGAQTGIEQWLPTSATDVSGEAFYNTVLNILGTSRKGDASKIRTVALAVRNNGLVLDSFPNLSKAYTEAVRITKGAVQHKEEDDAAEKAIEAIEAPKTTGSVEGAAALLLSKGIDGAVVAILDALGKDNEAAHRSFMRAVSTEIAARVQAKKPKPAPKKAAAPKAGATKAGAKKAAPKAKVGATKAKPVPTSASKGDPNKKALPKPNSAKAKPAQPADKGEPITEPVHAGDDVPTDAVEQAEQVVSTPKVGVKRRAVPVRRQR